MLGSELGSFAFKVPNSENAHVDKECWGVQRVSLRENLFGGTNTSVMSNGKRASGQISGTLCQT